MWVIQFDVPAVLRMRRCRVCVICMAAIVDAAMGWRYGNNVRVGLAHRVAGQEIRALRKPRRVS